MEYISRGTYGKVYKIDNNYAIKKIRKDRYYGFREIIMLALISPHDNIIKMFSARESYNNVKIKMPYYQYNLNEYIKNTDISFDDKIKIAVNITSAINHIHKHNIVHADIKSSNILLDSANNCVIADFGLAMISGAKVPFVPQSYGYGAPEAEENTAVSPTIDIWSLGCVLYELLIGSRFITITDNRKSHIDEYLKHYGSILSPDDHYKLMKNTLIRKNQFVTIDEKRFAKIISQCFEHSTVQRVDAINLLAQLLAINYDYVGPIKISKPIYSRVITKDITRFKAYCDVLDYSKNNIKLAVAYIFSALYNDEIYFKNYYIWHVKNHDANYKNVALDALEYYVITDIISIVNILIL